MASKLTFLNYRIYLMKHKDLFSYEHGISDHDLNYQYVNKFLFSFYL